MLIYNGARHLRVFVAKYISSLYLKLTGDWHWEVGMECLKGGDVDLQIRC